MRYGGFVQEWQRYTTEVEGGRECQYWYCQRLEKSTWDSPTSILAGLIMNDIDRDDKVVDWDGIEGTPFTRIKMQRGRPKNKIYELWLHRTTKQVFTQSPFAAKSEVRIPSTE